MDKVFLTDIEVAAHYGVHRVTPWTWVKKGILPAPVKISPGTTRWRVKDIEAHDRAAAERAQA